MRLQMLQRTVASKTFSGGCGLIYIFQCSLSCH